MKTCSIVGLCCLLVIQAAALAAPPQAEWFPQAKPLPAAEGQVIRVANVEELFQAAQDIRPGGTILLADGRYAMPRYFEIATDNVALRSASGNRHAVVLDGAGSRHGELIGITGCSGVTIADLTVANVKFNGIKINSDRGANRVTVHNCVLHNIWQRGVKAPGLRANADKLSPRDCRVQYCLFYNDRPKEFADDETDTSKTFNGNYIGGIDVKNTTDWTISDNVFIGLNGRTREGRGCIYISENGQGCTIERNVFLDCDIGVALGNPSLEIAKVHAVGCVVRNNLIAHCPETGILACYTRDCQITGNTIFDPDSRLGRLVWVQNANDGLRVSDNVFVGPKMLVTSDSKIVADGNLVQETLSGATKKGQQFLSGEQLAQAIELPAERAKEKTAAAEGRLQVGVQTPECIAAMRKVHEGFDGKAGYVAQLGDSITYSMAFWSPLGWDDPQQYLTADDGLPKTPGDEQWKNVILGTRDKGPEFANYSGWKVGQLLKSVDEALAREKPEAAIIMIGTNDISGGKVPDKYREQLEAVVGKCLDAHCVPILNTIPPRKGRDEAVAAANTIIRETAKKLNVPLADYHAEIIRLRPDDTWAGTLISGDGVHPSGGKTNIYTDENLKSCGYALRNWVNFLALRQIYFRVLHAEAD